MMAAALAKGRTTLVNCAREPEVEELGRVLNKMGAEVDGAGHGRHPHPGLRARRARARSTTPSSPTASRPGTYMVAAAIAEGGDVILEGAELSDMEALVVKMRAAGVEIASEGQSVRVRRTGPLRAVNVTTAPHPGFPTDMQAQFLVLMCTRARRERHQRDDLREPLHARPRARSAWAPASPCAGNTAVVQGVEKLYGASVMATDLRASASLVIAGLVAEDETEVRRVYHIDRGYERIEEKLRGLGAKIERVQRGGGVTRRR